MIHHCIHFARFDFFHLSLFYGIIIILFLFLCKNKEFNLHFYLLVIYSIFIPQINKADWRNVPFYENHNRAFGFY